MGEVDVYAVLGTGFSEFCSAAISPLLAVALIVASRFPIVGARTLRVLGGSGGALWSLPGALAAPALPEAGAALAGGLAGGMLLAELMLFVILPALRILKIGAATVIELSRFAVYRLTAGANRVPRPRKTDP